MPKTWFITGVSRGLGAEIAKAAMRAGDRIVAAGRKRSAIAEKLGPDSDSLLSVQLDVTDVVQVRTAVREAVHRFGGIEVLVNNAGYGHMGFFEEMTLKDVKEQFDTNLFGVFQVIWATLPLMRSARKGKIFNVSSIEDSSARRWRRFTARASSHSKDSRNRWRRKFRRSGFL